MCGCGRDESCSSCTEAMNDYYNEWNNQLKKERFERRDKFIKENCIEIAKTHYYLDRKSAKIYSCVVLGQDDYCYEGYINILTDGGRSSVDPQFVAQNKNTLSHLLEKVQEEERKKEISRLEKRLATLKKVKNA